MTPEEKEAKELINKMFNCDKETPNEAMAMLYPHAKECALIAIEYALQFVGGDLEEEFDKILYLVKLKEEIKKL